MRNAMFLTILFVSSSILFGQDMPKKITLKDIKERNYQKSYFALLPEDLVTSIVQLAAVAALIENIEKIKKLFKISKDKEKTSEKLKILKKEKCILEIQNFAAMCHCFSPDGSKILVNGFGFKNSFWDFFTDKKERIDGINGFDISTKKRFFWQPENGIFNYDPSKTTALALSNNGKKRFYYNKSEKRLLLDEGEIKELSFDTNKTIVELGYLECFHCLGCIDENNEIFFVDLGAGLPNAGLLKK